MSKGALHLPSGCALLRDSASGIWRVLAARLSRASSFFSCFQMPASSVATSFCSRWAMAFISTRLFVHQTALAQGRRKQRSDCCQQSIMPIGDYQIDFFHPTGAQILEQATPPIFVFLCAGSQCQYVL